MAVTRQQPKADSKPKKTPPAPKVEEETDAPKSKADLFDQTKAQGAIDAGKYVALISEMVLMEPNEKGQSVRVEYEIATEGEFRGQKVTQFYKIFEADESVGKGAAFLKKDLAVLGYSDVSFADLEEAFNTIVEQNVGVNVTVKHNEQFTNVYINSLCEDSSIVEEYLEQRVF
jgi:hypothetical protein